MPGALMPAIVESKRVRVERTRYVVPSWGVGELWTSADVVVAHEFDFEVAVDDEVLEPAHHAEPDSGIPTDVIARVRSHLAGDDISFTHVALDLDWCTPFQREVLSVLRSIPRGEVVSYGELAALAGRPGVTVSSPPTESAATARPASPSSGACSLSRACHSDHVGGRPRGARAHRPRPCLRPPRRGLGSLPLGWEPPSPWTRGVGAPPRSRERRGRAESIRPAPRGRHPL